MSSSPARLMFFDLEQHREGVVTVAAVRDDGGNGEQAARRAEPSPRACRRPNWSRQRAWRRATDLIPCFDRASLSSEAGDALRAKFFMGATTTKAIRRASQESLRALAKCYGINQKTAERMIGVPVDVGRQAYCPLDFPLTMPPWPSIIIWEPLDALSDSMCSLMSAGMSACENVFCTSALWTNAMMSARS